MRTSLRIGNITGSLLAMLLACGLDACTTQESNPPGAGGTSGGGSGGTTTPTGAGGSSTAGTTGATGAGDGTLCPAPQQTITDFTYVASGTGGSTTEVRFGSSGSLEGGESYYPNSGTYPLTVDVTQSNYHITGTIGDYAGFNIYFDNCDHLDASAFKGIRFTISGSVPSGNAITMGIGTINDTTTAAWLAANGKTDANPNAAGRCTPSQNTNNIYYHPGCGDPTLQIPVAATPTVKDVLWTDLTGGTPDANPNPKEITSIYWYFPWSGSGAAEYAVDLTLDDLQFIP
jgi:hypothetical protein